MEGLGGLKVIRLGNGRFEGLMWILAVSIRRLGFRVWGVFCQQKREEECFVDVNKGLKVLEDVWRTIRDSERN